MKRHRVHEGSFEEGHVWGCLVDRNNGRNVSHDERMVKTILRNHHSSRKKMFAPCFPANRSVFSQYFRNAGSGIYPLDAVRASSNVLSKSSIGNLISVLEKYVDMHTRMSREDWGFDTCLGAARSTLALLNQELAVIAVLFASKSWWVSEKKLFSVLGEDSEGECKLLDNLIRLEMVQFKPIGVDDAIAYVDSIDIEAENKATVNFFKMKKKESKLVVLVSCYKNERAAYEISEKYKSYRLCDSFYDQLAKCCSVVFAASYFTPEDAQNIFASKLLSSISLPEPPPILHCDVDRKMDKEFELRETFYLSVDLCSRLSESVMRGDHKSAQLALHESVCALEKLEIPDSNSFHNLTLPTARMLIIASLAGCHLLEREKRYADAEHYLQLLVNATQSSLHYSLLHADAVLRLARDLNHRKQSMTALQVVEKLLKQQGVAECVLWPANLCPNRLGGSGLAVIKLYLRLAVPPRRWRVSVPRVAKLKDPKSIRIHVEKGDSVENVVLKHFATTGGWKGMHAENGFTNTLFVLLFWDLLFNKEQWDCFHGFMELPPSVHDGSWIRNKTVKDQVQNRLNRISKDASFVVETITNCWNKCNGIHVRGMNWVRNELQDLLDIAQGLTGVVISMICSLYSEHYDAWQGGIPDLLLWKSGAQTKFVEVKGPGDSLSDSQRAWIQKLEVAQANALVCFVDYVSISDPLDQPSFN